jgi:hypothetical protein
MSVLVVPLSFPTNEIPDAANSSTGFGFPAEGTGLAENRSLIRVGLGFTGIDRVVGDFPARYVSARWSPSFVAKLEIRDGERSGLIAERILSSRFLFRLPERHRGFAAGTPIASTHKRGRHVTQIDSETFNCGGLARITPLRLPRLVNRKDIANYNGT